MTAPVDIAQIAARLTKARAVPVAAGDVVTATADRLGSVEIGCE
jgi:hypothetical protein